MRKRSKALTVINDESGASLLFVLGIMVMLLAVGVSALTAASAAAGAAANRIAKDRLNLYADSMHKAIKYSLFTSGSDAAFDNSAGNISAPYATERPKTLGGQIIGRIYNGYITEGAGDFSLTLEPDTGALGADMSVYEVTAEVKPNQLLVTEYVSPQPAVTQEMEDSEGNIYTQIVIPEVPRTAQAAVISGRVTVTVSVTLGSRSLISVAEYEFIGARLSDDGVTNPFNGNMYIRHAGDWGFISYETV